VQQLFEEITALGYTGSLNLLYKYINQGRRLDGDRITPPTDPLDPDTTNGNCPTADVRTSMSCWPRAQR
jgi:hypothetical protein